MAVTTCEAVTLPDEQAEPDEAAIPARSRAIRAVSVLQPGTANRVVFGSRSEYRSQLQSDVDALSDAFTILWQVRERLERRFEEGASFPISG